MGRRGDGYGSEHHFISYRSNHPERLDEVVNRALPNLGLIDWLYPKDGVCEEPRDLAFLELSEPQIELWHDFWPNSGNRRWDGIARCNGDWLLFEAKANETEFNSPGTDASPKSFQQIIEALGEVKRHLRVPQETVWHQKYYQYANRIAVVYFLNVVAKIPAHLIFLYFTGDAFPDGRTCPHNEQDWRLLIDNCHAALKLPSAHPLSDRIHEVFLPVHERLVRWIESGDRLQNLGHGVQFLHDALQPPVGFLEGFGWRGGGAASIMLLSTCPTSISANDWLEIIESTREAVLVFLSNEGNLNGSFRHGPIHILING